MTDREIDELLEHRAASLREGPQPAVLERITAAAHASLLPVRPIPTARSLVGALLLVAAGLALIAATQAGFAGFLALGPIRGTVIFTTLVAVAWLTARELVSHWIPGSRHYIGPWALVLLVEAVLVGVFASLFRDYHTEHFLSAGLACLSTGVLHAIPAACLGALLLRRGYALNPIAAGTIAGALGGISGVTTLELICSNLEAPHVLLWHIAVVPVSAVVGATIGWLVGCWKSR